MQQADGRHGMAVVMIIMDGMGVQVGVDGAIVVGVRMGVQRARAAQRPRAESDHHDTDESLEPVTGGGRELDPQENDGRADEDDRTAVADRPADAEADRSANAGTTHGKGRDGSHVIGLERMHGAQHERRRIRQKQCVHWIK
jgi:hypothetical protein